MYLLCMCVLCVFVPFILDVRTVGRTSRGVTQEEGHTGFFIHLSAALALIFLARRIQPFFSLVDRVCVFSSHPFWTSSSLDVQAGGSHRRKVTQDF